MPDSNKDALRLGLLLILAVPATIWGEVRRLWARLTGRAFRG